MTVLIQLPGSPRTVLGEDVDVSRIKEAADVMDDSDWNVPSSKGKLVPQPSPPASQRYVSYDDRPLPVMRKYVYHAERYAFGRSLSAFAYFRSIY